MQLDVISFQVHRRDRLVPSYGSLAAMSSRRSSRVIPPVTSNSHVKTSSANFRDQTSIVKIPPNIRNQDQKLTESDCKPNKIVNFTAIIEPVHSAQTKNATDNPRQYRNGSSIHQNRQTTFSRTRNECSQGKSKENLIGCTMKGHLTKKVPYSRPGLMRDGESGNPHLHFRSSGSNCDSQTSLHQIVCA